MQFWREDSENDDRESLAFLSFDDAPRDENPGVVSSHRSRDAKSWTGDRRDPEMSFPGSLGSPMSIGVSMHLRMLADSGDRSESAEPTDRSRS